MKKRYQVRETISKLHEDYVTVLLETNNLVDALGLYDSLIGSAAVCIWDTERMHLALHDGVYMHWALEPLADTLEKK